MAKFAENTSVTSDASRAEIERTLVRYGADSFMYGWDKGRAIVGFVIANRQVRFTLDMPDRTEKRFTHTPERNLRRTDAQAEKEYEQAVKQRWRALALVIKAKLEAVESGITTLEEEFLAQIMLPSGETTMQWLGPQVAKAYESGQMPSLLPPAPRKEIGS